MAKQWMRAALVLALGAGITAGAPPPAGRLAPKRYVDPKGNFSIAPPEGWQVEEYPSDPRGKVAFRSPDGRVDLRILTNAVEFSTREELVSSLKQIEGRLGVNTNIRNTVFAGREAVERTIEFRGQRFRAYDLLVGRTDHNLQYGGDPGLFDRHLPLALLSMETYEPQEKTITAADVRAQSVAKMKRLAELMLQNGQTELAADYVRRGLEMEPKNADLLKLQGQVEARRKGR
jgi:hypothetical protein